jgi:hypothetical protein
VLVAFGGVLSAIAPPEDSIGSIDRNGLSYVRGHFFAERFDAVKLADDEQRLATSLQINSLAVRLGLESDVANSRFTAAYARLHGNGDWLAGELTEDVSSSSAESSASESEDSDASKSAHESNKSRESNGSNESEGEAAAEGAGTAEGAGVADSSG